MISLRERRSHDSCQATKLHERAGVEIAILAVRGDISHWNSAQTFYSSPRVKNFFTTSLGVAVTDITARMETYIVSGAAGKSLPCKHYSDMLTISRPS